ncbi:Diguanylate cyclase (Modular protein) [Candidatus Methylobacter favarea]|uniref:Diguanylate cyclase (Modular protein) n=1 Tax=Candidatus Methylobacter favarea TaxID=2707345 RepID=A0A8S0WBA7_9GAMM|nr:GGDEF domain-containing protein [Candidatus Methylobacter favarea]CAA9891563.1 Diguanylate cyclase (Modular protein) [Candidatus Methylobacter favarea]
MKNNPGSTTTGRILPVTSMTRLLGQSEHVKDLVEECAEELSSVNTVLKEEAAGHNQQSGIDYALEKSEAIEGKVQEAADKLTVVNQALQVEVEVRHMLDQRLTMVTQEEAVARHAAFHDPLTGLPNRALFDNRVEHGLAQAKRYGWTLAVMFMDLDDFKQINDVYGHDVGDAVLKTVAERLKHNTREADTVSRHGGDEFLCLMMKFGDVRDINFIAEKIANAIQVPCQLSTGELIIKPSIGISIFPKDGITGFDLVKSADQAMYEAKRNKSGYAFAQ